MKNTQLILLFLIISSSGAFCQDNRILSIGFVNTNIRFVQGKNEMCKPMQMTEVSAWKGEKVSLQIMVLSSENISNFSIDCTPLVNTKGNKINAIKARFINYVKTDKYIPDCVKHRVNEYDSLMVADVINETKEVSINANIVQPIWVTVQIPMDCSSGLYIGKITTNTNNELTLQLKVGEHQLPLPSDWSFDLDLWQHPAAIARIHSVPIWSDEHFNLMKPYFQMLANAGQKNVTTSIINEPWGHQTYDDFPTLIVWKKKKNGDWEYDFSLFDKYVSFVMKCGINKRINCYTMIPWALSFKYFDENLGCDTTVQLKTNSNEYKVFWTTMLKEFTKHLKEKNWFNITSISVDERPLDDMKIAIQILKDVDKNWKIALAGAYHPEIEKDIFDYSIASKMNFGAKTLQVRKAHNKPSTFYTCCVEESPNGFTFSPPADNVWLSWYAASKGFTGYLRWAFNSWPLHPSEDSRYTAWPGGDTYQIYPGPRTSIRFEKLIEGIQDFEKIKILRADFVKTKNYKKLKKLDSVLNNFQIKNLKKGSSATMIMVAQKFINE